MYILSYNNKINNNNDNNKILCSCSLCVTTLSAIYISQTNVLVRLALRIKRKLKLCTFRDVHMNTSLL